MTSYRTPDDEDDPIPDFPPHIKWLSPDRRREWSRDWGGGVINPNWDGQDRTK